MPFQTHNPRASSPWTEERVALLLKLDGEDVLSRAEIAEELRVRTGSTFTRNAVICKLAALGVPTKEAGTKRKPRVWKEEQIALLLSLREANLSATQIAKKIHAETGAFFSRNAILGKLHRVGAPPAQKQKLSARPKSGRPIRIFRPKKIPIFPEIHTQDPVAIQDSLALPLESLTEATCHYPTNLESESFAACGHPIHKRSYCATHYRICYYAPKPSRPDVSHRMKILNARKFRSSLLKPACEAA